jgi:hypothetical protein
MRFDGDQTRNVVFKFFDQSNCRARFLDEDCLRSPPFVEGPDHGLKRRVVDAIISTLSSFKSEAMPSSPNINRCRSHPGAR